MNLTITFPSVQSGEKLDKIIGLVSALELAKMMDGITLRPNPRSPNVNKITKAITETLETAPELLQYKTKGILAAGKLIGRNGDSFDIDFATPTFGGILDGGHNFLAIVRVLMMDAVRHKYSSFTKEDKKIRKEVDSIRSLRDLTEKWRTYRNIVFDLVHSLNALPPSARAQQKLGRKLSFLLPIEIIVPCARTTESEVSEIIHEISVARNNNVQLKEVAIAQHKGSYELLKVVLPAEVNDKVQWKCGVNECPIPPTKVVPLALLPLKKLEEAGILAELSKEIQSSGGEDAETEEAAFPSVKLMSMYTSTAASVSIYSQVIDAVTNLKDFGGATRLVDSIVNSLDVISALPRIWDTIEVGFEDYFGMAVTGNEKKYSDLPCNNKGPAKKETPARYFTRQIPKDRYVCRGGFITPLFMAVCSAFMVFDGEKVSWVIPPDQLIHELSDPSDLFKPMIKEYVQIIKTVDYDPSKFGKSPIPYEAIQSFGSFMKWANYVKHR